MGYFLFGFIIGAVIVWMLGGFTIELDSIESLDAPAKFKLRDKK